MLQASKQNIFHHFCLYAFVEFAFVEFAFVEFVFVEFVFVEIAFLQFVFSIEKTQKGMNFVGCTFSELIATFVRYLNHHLNTWQA